MRQVWGCSPRAVSPATSRFLLDLIAERGIAITSASSEKQRLQDQRFLTACILTRAPELSSQLPLSVADCRVYPAANRPEGSGLLCLSAAQGWAGRSRYKQKKELENRLASVRTFVDSGQADEDQIREFYLLQIQKWVNISFEEIESIDQEMVILRSRDSSAPPHGTSRQVRAPLKPFILTRDAVQSKVFGAGYPSLPTMTVNDWYDQRRREEAMPDISDEELQKQQQEKKEEEDDEEALQKARDWDDWKDTHPRGYGNRQNMG
uniref:Immunoglobulin-binding protein 1 n=1 Tax=Anser cygnoides TaxID=8845 RepID=A0A8B9DAI5_ANSCY